MQIKLKVENMGAVGEGVGRFEGMTVFVDGALPGEEIQAQLFKKEKRYAKGRLVEIEKPSPFRVVPACPHFERCGGCQIMHLEYGEQLRVKRQKVVDALKRIGKIECAVEACIPSPQEMGYRNKMQAQVKGGRFGFYARRSNELVEVEGCKIHNGVGDRVYREVVAVLKKHQFYPRHLILKTSMQSSEVLVILVTMEDPTVVARDLLEIEGVAGVVHNLNDRDDNVVLGKEFREVAGRGFLLEKIAGLEFKISPASFFQVNPLQAEQLYLKALQLAELTGKETVLDAYCGVGTLSLLFARGAKKVIGVECVEEAIADARENAIRNHSTNAEFLCGKSEELIDKIGAIDLILLNPPRKGCEKSFLDGIGRLGSQRVLYISCDPATLARDLAHLQQYGYRVEHVQPFDMFPQTAHVETVVLLSKGD